MNRRFFIILAMAVGLAAPAAMAQSADAKAVVDAAKAQGVVGEQGDGFLGLVNGSPDASVKSAMDEINAGRAKAYQDIATKTGVSQAAAGEATAVQLLARLPAGYYYRPLGGSWMKK